MNLTIVEHLTLTKHAQFISFMLTQQSLETQLYVIFLQDNIIHFDWCTKVRKVDEQLLWFCCLRSRLNYLT